jgi:hypothetical protein
MALSMIRIFVVIFPIRRVGFDVFPDFAHFTVVADDVFVVYSSRLNNGIFEGLEFSDQ